jgi:hypothetical protein
VLSRDQIEASITGNSFVERIAGVSEDRVLLIKGERSVPALSSGTASTELPAIETLSAMTAADAYVRLAASAPMRRLRDKMAVGPVTLTMVERTLGDPGSPPERRIALGFLDQAARAECRSDSFLPLRVHLFHRAQSGIWACINPECSGRTGASARSIGLTSSPRTWNPRGTRTMDPKAARST